MLRRLPLLAALILWLPGVLMAQSFGTLKGQVVDKDGKPVQGATIKIVETTKGAISKADGGFLIAGVTAGEYDVTITSVGYQPFTTKVRISINQTTTISPELMTRPPGRVRWGCGFRGPVRPERMGTTHTISAEALDRSPRPTLFGGGY